ncbi:hypothetical protein PENTCL1PPCAC_17031, partial [Pristionchus entomophagus]
VFPSIFHSSTMLIPLFIGILLLLVYSLIRYYKFVSGYPKGPTPLPFIGNFLEMDFGSLDKSYERLSDGFNGLCTVFFPLPIIHIKDYRLIREAFIEKGDDFVDRPQLRMLKLLRSFSDDGGVVNSNGEIWREQRRTAISILRDFGMGKNLMEQLVNSSVTNYLKHLEMIKDKENVNMRWPIQIMIANIINELLFGFRYEYDNCDALIRYVEDLNSIMSEIGKNKFVLLGIAFPFLNNIPVIGYHTFHKHKEHARFINQYIVDCVDRAMESYKEDEEPTCFVHAYKQRMAKNDRLENANMMITCSEFFLAGQETTTTTLRWAMLILAKHTKIQEILRSEILAVVGEDRIPSLKDQTEMPYSRAVVHEIQRFANILGTNGLRMTTRDTEVGGHFIPSGTIVNADIHYVMAHDPMFENPEEFRPERYLSEDGKGLKKDLVDRTLPFSLGKRVCIGESLARAELFLGLTATIQRHRLSARPGAEIDLQPLSRPIKIPKEQNIVIERV